MNLLRFAKAVFTLLFVLGIILIPVTADAASSKEPLCSSEATADITQAKLTTTSSKPTLSGTATSTKTIQLIIRKDDESKTLYKSKVIKVREGEWKTRVTKKLKKDTYTIEVFCPKVSKGTSLTTETLVVGKVSKTQGSFAVASIPLLAGGVAYAHTSVPVSYLQITNTGKTNATLTGFSVKQNGSAQTETITGFTSVDDTGTLRGSTESIAASKLFDKGVAFVPITASFTPGQMRLFTIKAVIGSTSSHVGKQLKIDVVSVSMNAATKSMFPIRGTTWTLQ